MKAFLLKRCEQLYIESLIKNTWENLRKFKKQMIRGLNFFKDKEQEVLHKILAAKQEIIRIKQHYKSTKKQKGLDELIMKIQDTEEKYYV